MTIPRYFILPDYKDEFHLDEHHSGNVVKFDDIASLDAEFAARLAAIPDEVEVDHIAADKLLIELLQKLSLTQTAAKYAEMSEGFYYT